MSLDTSLGIEKPLRLGPLLLFNTSPKVLAAFHSGEVGVGGENIPLCEVNPIVNRS